MNKHQRIFLYILLLFFLSCESSSQKKSILAGFHQGSMFSWTIELFTDSTFFYSNGIQLEGRWELKNDSIHLYSNNYLIKYGTIVNEATYKVNEGDKELKPLKYMKFKKFNPPKVVVFPKSE